jgi:DNA-directed RNA polymerase subunit RPC12/RpoP
MIFKCQSCGKLFPISQAEPWYDRDLENLNCPKCYIKRVGDDSLVNVMSFMNVAY